MLDNAREDIGANVLQVRQAVTQMMEQVAGRTSYVEKFELPVRGASVAFARDELDQSNIRSPRLDGIPLLIVEVLRLDVPALHVPFRTLPET